MSVGSTLPCKWETPMSAPQIPPYKMERPAYSTPPPVENIPANNECRMVDLRGSKVASFILGCEEYICLPQVFDLFLKHLVGGLHTVYTKLKRLSIAPVVCNVEQVRILRGLGAIQPGVNRCKLITRKDFEILYQDCTTASRPGRPPKRYPVLPPTTDLLHANIRSSNTLLNSDLAVLQKRMRLDQSLENRANGSPNKDSDKALGNSISLPSDLHNNPGANLAYLQALRQQYQQAAVSGLHNGLDPQQINPALAPFMMMSHPALFASGLPPNSMAMLNHINQIAHSHAASGAMTSVAVAAAQLAANGAKLNKSEEESSAQSIGALRSPTIEKDSEGEETHTTHRNYGHTLGLSNGIGSEGRTSPTSSTGSLREDGQRQINENNNEVLRQVFKNATTAVTQSNVSDLADAVTELAKTSKSAPSGDDEMKPPEASSSGSVSSMQTLLINIQGLLKVAADNASLQEKHSSFEIAELKHKLHQERQIREATEIKLNECEKERADAEKRYINERKENKKLQSRLVSMQQLLGHDLNNNRTHDGDVEITSPRSSPPSTNGVNASDVHSEPSSSPASVTSPLSTYSVTSSFDVSAFNARIAAAAVATAASQQAGNKPPSPTRSPGTPTSSSSGINKNGNNNNNPAQDDRKSPDYSRRSIVTEPRVTDLAIDLVRSRSEHNALQEPQRIFFKNQLLFQQPTASQ